VKVREANVTGADKRSARLFFDALMGFYDTDKWAVLDAFARNGQLTLPMYIKAVRDGYVEAWELGPEHEKALKMLGPNQVRIGDSYSLAVECERMFDMVVIDTPQGAHKDSHGYVHYEHFDFLELTLRKLLKDRGVVVLYVNKSPYDKAEVGSHGYDEYAEYDFGKWMDARLHYYQSSRKTLTEERVVDTYRGRAHAAGYQVKNILIVPCFSDVPGKEPYAFRLALELERS
jgi:tRNA G37 N-methylase Trm5